MNTKKQTKNTGTPFRQMLIEHDTQERVDKITGLLNHPAIQEKHDGYYIDIMMLFDGLSKEEKKKFIAQYYG